MSAAEDEATSHEHDDSTYAPAPPAVDDKGDPTNPPSGPAVEQTRGAPGAGATRSGKKGAKKEEG